MSMIDILTHVEAICKKYDMYAIDKQKDLNVSSGDAFARLYSVVEADIGEVLQASTVALNLISVCDEKMAFRRAVVGPAAASTLGTWFLGVLGVFDATFATHFLLQPSVWGNGQKETLFLCVLFVQGDAFLGNPWQCLHPRHPDTCFCRLKHVDFGFSIFGSILKLGYKPNVVTFNSLIKGLCMDEEVAEAMDLFNKMVRKDYPCSEQTYGIIIDGLYKAENIGRALRLLREMEEKGRHKPKLIICGTIIDSLCKDGLIDEALKLFSEMTARSISPNVIIFAFMHLVVGVIWAFL
ncbi:hypothetical protein NE237_007911 [Protea cynaroides]|uniref:Pentatricopeptide repeat-containing protein n=1 Tax=Protea cynaroides TaxID=273540 RepID=A0A9Q0KQ31_9MAGN|nr:hypothetical protein NE237_007911 [Protea cynaroides]